MSSLESLKTIEHILQQYTDDLNALSIPSLQDFASTPTLSAFAQSPYLNKYKLQQLEVNLQHLRSQLLAISSHNNKNYTELTLKLNQLVNDTLEEKRYVNSQMIQLFDSQNQTLIQKDIPTVTSDSDTKQSQLQKLVKLEEEDLPSLRQRLLHGGKHTQLLDERDHEKLNDYHESIQDDIINELSELTTTLKNSAYTLSQKILSDDLSILNETNENMIRNSNLFKVIDKNLNNYLENKTGGKIGLFMLIKLTVGIVVGFLFMILLIKIIPQIG